VRGKKGRNKKKREELSTFWTLRFIDLPRERGRERKSAILQRCFEATGNLVTVTDNQKPQKNV